MRARDLPVLEQALREAGLETSRTDDAALRADAEPAVVGLVARELGLALTELRADGGGLENMFLELTADTQRDTRRDRTAA